MLVVTTRILLEMFQAIKVNLKIGENYEHLNFPGSIQNRDKPNASIPNLNSLKRSWHE